MLSEETIALVQHSIPLLKKNNVQSNQYLVVKKCLLDSMKEVLKDKLSENTLNVWSETYNVLYKMFINKETELYKDTK